MNVLIRSEIIANQATIRNVNQEAFGGDTESHLVDALRDGGFTEISVVAERNGKVIGHILCNPVTIITKLGTGEAWFITSFGSQLRPQFNL